MTAKILATAASLAALVLAGVLIVPRIVIAACRLLEPDSSDFEEVR